MPIMTLKVIIVLMLVLTPPALAGEGDDRVFSFFQMDQNEVRVGDHDGYTWEAQGWVGTDFDKAYLKTRGELEFGGGIETPLSGEGRVDVDGHRNCAQRRDRRQCRIESSIGQDRWMQSSRQRPYLADRILGFTMRIVEQTLQHHVIGSGYTRLRLPQ